MRIILSLYVCFGLVAQVLSQNLVSYWYEWIAKQGVAPYNSQGSAYQVYRNVKTFGAKGSFFQLL
jgi:glucan 1,3-beta-glucosidase